MTPEDIKNLENELIEERKAIVLDILSRGKKAVFKRCHSIYDDVQVIKKVTEWKADIDEETGMYDIYASECENASTPWIALWDSRYIISEE